jgi:hypothetical protein
MASILDYADLSAIKTVVPYLANETDADIIDLISNIRYLLTLAGVSPYFTEEAEITETVESVLDYIYTSFSMNDKPKISLYSDTTNTDIFDTSYIFVKYNNYIYKNSNCGCEVIKSCSSYISHSHCQENLYNITYKTGYTESQDMVLRNIVTSLAYTFKSLLWQNSLNQSLDNIQEIQADSTAEKYRGYDEIGKSNKDNLQKMLNFIKPYTSQITPKTKSNVAVA